MGDINVRTFSTSKIKSIPPYTLWVVLQHFPVTLGNPSYRLYINAYTNTGRYLLMTSMSNNNNNNLNFNPILSIDGTHGRLTK